jgi:hypothetical protein
MRALAFIGFLVAASASVGIAQDTTSLIAGDRAASGELSKIIDATRGNGLPVEPILAKIRYAVLVAHAPAPRIIAAARATAARLEEARAALAPNPTPLDIAAGEDALSSHVSSRSLQDVRRASGNRPVAVPLGVLAQLVTNHVEEKKATKIVTDLIRNGATGEQLVALGNEVNSDVQLGAKPNNALDLRTNRLSAVLGVPGGAANNTDALTAGAAPTVPGKKKP